MDSIVMEKRFVTTMNEIPGYEIVETRGVFCETMGFRGPERMIKGLMVKAEAEGCNAIVRLRVISGYGGGTCVYGDGVIIRPKSANVPEAPVLPEVPDFTNPDNQMNW